MKKNLLLLVLALIGMGGFTACNNEDELLVQEQTETKPVVIRATIGNVSRLALGNSDGTSTKVSWSEGDAFALTIGDKSYTFNWTGDNDFEYANDNGTFPETFATAGTITATYPATAAGELSVQSGIMANVGNYMQMVAELDVNAGDATDDLNLNFEHQTSVVEIALEKSELRGKSVVVDLRTITASKYSTPAEEGVLSFDSNGILTVYFAVSPTDEVVKEWYVGVKDIAGNKYYTAKLSDLQLDASKMYKVNKTGEDLKNTSYLVSADEKTVIAYDAEGLNKWAEMVSQNTTTNIINLELGADITLPTEGITLTDGLPDKGNWTPLVDPDREYSNHYRGTIDGKNHTIKNMYIVYKENWPNRVGFIGGFDGNIKNLKFDNAKIVGNPPASSVGYYIGVVSGISCGIIDNCHVTNSTVKCPTNGLGCPTGGLVGKLNSLNYAYDTPKIINSSFSGTVEGNMSVGGIAGNLECSVTGYSYITNCSVKGNIKGQYKVGGLVGDMGIPGSSAGGYGVVAALEMCTNEATVTGAVSGGIVGFMSNYAYVVGCTNQGEIYGTYYDTSSSVVTKSGTGGIVGLMENEQSYTNKSFVIGCRNLSDKVYLSATEGSDRIGGIVGYQNKAESGVYGSYTVPSVANAEHGNHAQATFGVVVTGHTNSYNNAFDSPEDDEIPGLLSTMNTAIENGFTAAAEANFYKDDKSAYKDYRWSWTSGSGSWPVFKASVADE